MCEPDRARPGHVRLLVVPGLVAAAVFWIAYDNGSYGVESRNALAVAVWWSIIVGVAFRALSLHRLRRPAGLIVAVLAGLAALTLLSLTWAANDEAAFDEFNRVTLYLGVFVLVAMLVPRGRAGRWADGLALAIALIALLALVSRLFPDLFDDRGLATFLPSAATRLSFPVGYWNGLGILLALGVPLLLRFALADSAVVRALGLMPFPIVGAVVYLTSSRGAVATLLMGVIVFFALTERRWEAAWAIIAGAAGQGAAVVVLSSRDALVNGPIGSSVAVEQGRSAAVLLAVLAVVTGCVFAAGSAVMRRARPPRVVGWAALAGAVALTVVGVAAADPAERAREFRKPPGEVGALDQNDLVRAHLLSGSGSGRWQFWSAAVDEWRAQPVHGGGAGSYEAWWAQHGSFTAFIRDAHSLYLETLGELGPLGLLLILTFVSATLVVGVSRARALEGPNRDTVAGLTAVVAGFAVAAGIDWMWELTVVTVVAVVASALLTGAATEPPMALRPVGASEGPGRRFGVAVLALVVAWAIIVAQAIPLLTQYELRRSRDAVRSGDPIEARTAALAARDIEPWAASPYLQLALIDERVGQLASARLWTDDAIERSPKDWRVWLVAARLDTKLGRVAAASRSLSRAVELNPRSPLFARLEVSRG